MIRILLILTFPRLYLIIQFVTVAGYLMLASGVVLLPLFIFVTMYQNKNAGKLKDVSSFYLCIKLLGI